ncbi:hypothetical protein [Azospirillum sp. TSO5]|uniref:hypothetical protein n=1 Tax=Azospirillum sp. TSO5 TaxID=716760 RepID=UPI000D658E3F|nr:hypothetical protein [Azospirillum sp. TSO5]
MVGLLAIALSGCAGAPPAYQATRYCAAKDGFAFETRSASCAPLAQEVAFSEYRALKDKWEKRTSEPSSVAVKPSAPVGWAAKKVPVTAALQAAAEEAVRKDLKDPESARFRPPFMAFRDESGDIAVCGYANAKNSYGGYVGFEPFRAFIGERKNGYFAAGAVFGGGRYPQTFYELHPMCDARNW